MTKRIVALVLSVAMVLSFLPFSVFAEGTETETTNRYAAGEGASYLLDVPDAEALDETAHTTTQHTTLSIRKENGENFIVYDEPYKVDEFTGEKVLDAKNENNDVVTGFVSKINAAQLTYGGDETYESGLPEEITIGTDPMTTYLAIRIKINDNSDAFAKTASTLRLSLVKTDGEKIPFYTTKAYPSRWFDLKDGSMVYFRPSSNYSADTTGRGFDFTGDMDGYMLIPFKMYTANNVTTSLLTADDLKDFAGFEIGFCNNDTVTSYMKASSWEDKELLLGDCMLVNDVEAFTKARSEKRGVADKMYSPNLEDTAYYASRVSGFRTFFMGHADNSNSSASCRSFFASKRFEDPNTKGQNGNYRHFLHVTTLPNGDRAFEIFVPSAVTQKTGTVFTWSADAYDDTKIAAGGYVYETTMTVRVGTPDVIDATKINAFAFRIATKDGTVPNEAFTFGLVLQLNTAEPGAAPVQNSASSVTAYYMTAGEYTYVDANTGKTEKLTADASGNISYTGNLDGYILAPYANFNTVVDGTGTALTQAKIENSWGGSNWCSTWKTGAPIGYKLVSGFENEKALYAGDTFFVQNTDAFTAYHTDCDKVGHSWLAGETVKETCDTDGSIAYTCQREGCTATKTETIPAAHDNIVIDEGTEATCTTDGISKGSHCETCSTIIVAQEKVPAAHTDGEVTSNEDGTHSYACSVCKETAVRTEECSYKETAENTFTCEICEHSYVKTVCEHTNTTVVGKVDATCESEGYTGDTVCADCEEPITSGETIPALGHSKLGETVNAKHYCENECGTVLYDLEEKLATGEYALEYNIKTDATIVIDSKVTLDLNGKTIEITEKDTVGDGVFRVVAGGELTLNGEGTVAAAGTSSEYKMAIWADGGKVVINGGTYTNDFETEETQFDLIYVKNGGTIEINGGMFISATPKWTLNKNDKTEGTIIVKGGTFYKYDPAGNFTENPTVSWLAEGYDVVADGDYYKVVAHVCEFTYDSKVTEPTCKEQGYTTYFCKCGETKVDDYTNPVDHKYAEEGTVVEPTETATGYTEYACEFGCGTTKKDSYTAPTSGKLANVTATQVAGSYNIKTTFDALEGASDYIVYIYDSEGNKVINASADAVKGVTLYVGKPGVYTVKAIASIGGKYLKVSDANAVEVTVKSLLPEAPAAVIDNITNTGFTVNWVAVEGAEEYFIKISGNGTTIHKHTTATSINITCLAVDAEYTVSINAKLGVGKYTGYEKTTVASTKPYAVIDITATPGENGIALAWEVVEGTADMYWVKRVDAEGNVTQIAATTNTSINVKSIDGDNNFYIIARTQDGNGINRYVTTKTVNA